MESTVFLPGSNCKMELVIDTVSDVYLRLHSVNTVLLVSSRVTGEVGYKPGPPNPPEFQSLCRGGKEEGKNVPLPRSKDMGEEGKEELHRPIKFCENERRRENARDGCERSCVQC